MEFEISLNDLLFYSFHGVYEEEKKTGNQFRVNLTVFLPFNEKVISDELGSTVSYASLYEIVKEEMDKPKNLLEKVTFEITRRIKEEYPEIKKGRIEVIKVHPPIPGMLGSASVVLNF